jgi:hypothetical protein
MTPALYAACVRAVHVVAAEGRVLRAGRACLFILDQIGYHRFARLFSRRPLIWATELGYWLVARNRAFIGRFLLRGESPLPGAHDSSEVGS